MTGPGQSLDIDPTSTANAVEVDSGASSTGTLCLAATGNTIADPHTGTHAISVNQEGANSVFAIQDYTGSGTSDGAVESYLAAGNTFSDGSALAQFTSVAGFGGTDCQPPQTVSG